MACGLLLLQLAGGGAAAAATIDSLTVGDANLTVKWSEGGGIDPVTSNDLRYIRTDADETVDANWTVVTGIWSSGPREYVLTGLTNGVGYDVQVRPVTTNAGLWSATVAATPIDPGSTRATATALSLTAPFLGAISPGDDVDYFEIALSGATGLAVYTTGALDTVGVLESSTGTTLVSNDDGGMAGGPRNFLLLHSASASATVYVKATSYGTATGAYAIHAHAIADTSGTSDASDIALGGSTLGIIDPTGDDDYYKLTLAAAADLAIWTTGTVADTIGELQNTGGTKVAGNDDGYLHTGERQFLIRASVASGTYYVKVSPYGEATGLYRLHVRGLTEPGSTIGAAGSLGLGVMTGGAIDPTTDEDYFRIDLASDSWVYLRAVSTTVDIDGALVDSGDNEATTNLYEQTLGSGNSTTYAFTLSDQLAAGTHYLKVSRSGGAATGNYGVLGFADAAQEGLLTGCSGGAAGSIEDPQYKCQWHLKNTGQLGGTSGEDIDIEGVWASGRRGAGVRVVVVDDGMDYRHEDLAANVDTTRNHDYGSGDVFDRKENHGTAVSGIVAARDNEVGGRGVAPRATIFSHRLLGFTTAANEADAMTRSSDVAAVSNNSWGPTDDPDLNPAFALWRQAIVTGVTTGYGGKGVFYAWAAGNGAGDGDYSNLDEYSNHYGVAAVCAVNDLGKRSWYSEMGSNLWICAPSSDGQRDRPGIFTTNNYSRHTARFGGTSAATPIVSGVAGLVRNSYPNLSWRDVKLILAGSARKVDAGDGGWETGAAKYGSSGGRYEFNHQYGFGAVDAAAAMRLAAGWTGVPAQLDTTSSTVSSSLTVPDAAVDADGTTVTSSVEVASQIDFVEYVVVDATFAAPAFRHLLFELVSPSGAVSRLSVPYFQATGFHALDGQFRFGSARHLGERASGEWTLRLTDQVNLGTESELTSWSLKFYGHKSRPRTGGPGGAAPPAIDSIGPGPGSLTVAWSAPPGAGSAVSSWDLRLIRTAATDRADENWTVFSGLAADTLRVTLSDLAGETSYDVQVRAVTGAGAGPWSETASGRTEAAGPPPPSGPPEAAFTVGVDCPEDLCGARTGERVRFQDTSAGVVRRRTWDFGDGRTSTSASPSHVWSSPGFYTVTLTVGDGTVESTASRVFLVEASEPAGSCVPDRTTRCLRDSRYQVRAEWWTAAAAAEGEEPVPARVVRLGTNDSGVFQFFGRENWEVLIKVLDGCAINGHVWVFGASATDLGLAVEVTDTVTGATRRYAKEPGPAASAIADNRAFAGSCAAAVQRGGVG